MDFKIPQYNLKHTRPIVGYGNFTNSIDNNKDCFLIKDIVKKKFKIWDKIVDHNLLSNEDPMVRAEAVNLLNDKTILAYSQLKFDNEPVKMMYLQDAILSDQHDRILFCGCNQHIGKSFTLNVDSATEFLVDHSKNWIGILVSGSLPQSQFQMDRIKMLLKSSDISYREENTIDTKTGKKDNTTQLSYTFYAEDQKTPKYRNLLICCPHTSSALGYPADVLWLDEFDFWENCDQEHFLYQIAIPRTFRTKGKIKVYTNPDGKEKMMYKLWNQKDGEGNPAWHRYNFNFWDKPGANQKEFDKAIIGMTKGRVESTLLGMFTRTEGAFFSSDEIADMYDPILAEKGDQAGYGKETVWFLDVGVVHDQCALVGAYLEENLEVSDIPLIKEFYIHKYPQGYPLARVIGVPSAIQENDGWEDYTEDNPTIREILDEYSEEVDGRLFQPLFGFDATGNAGLIPLFQSVNIDAADIIFSGQRKWHMYQRYQYYVQQRFIKRGLERDNNTLGESNFDYQMAKLMVKKNKTSSYKQIHHEQEGDLDDTQDATVGMIHLIENPDMPSLSFDIIDGKVKIKKSEDGEEFPEFTKEELRRMNKDTGKASEEYIPSFYDKGEYENWREKRERSYY